MQTKTILLIILAVIVALVVVLFQYYYRTKKRERLYTILSFLRFTGIFGVLLLLINPKFTKEEFTIEKGNLILLIDDSSSMKEENKTNNITSFLDMIKQKKELTDRFNLEQYHFGTELKENTSLSFNKKYTDITKAISTINDIYANGNNTIVLLTDGNQTLGEDYEFYGKNQKHPIYPIAIGDTTSYKDIRIGQVNTNKYTFLKNKFPVESFISYKGIGNVSSTYTISVEGKTIFRKRILLSSTANTKVINTYIGASTVGIKTIKIALTPLKNEKNTLNNQRRIAIEVIDEKTTVAIISDIKHSDIGALKKSIEQNLQAVVKLKKPTVNIEELEDVDVFILYQPNRLFAEVYNYLKVKKPSIFTITGSETDWNFLNKIQNSFTKSNYNQLEEVSPVLNSRFTTFDISDFSIDGYPPLENNIGEITIHKINDIILNQRIKGIQLKDPLLAIVGDVSEREAVLFGENLWKWRSQSYRNDKNFRNFDDLINKIILYLATNSPRARLSIDYEPIYTGVNKAIIKASYFDKVFIFDPNASLSLKIKNKDNGTSKALPMLLKGNQYKANIDGLIPGKYSFTITEKREKLSKSGLFRVLDFDVEQQFSATNYKKLYRFAQNTGGKLYFPSEGEDLLQNLLDNNRFSPTQKIIKKVVSLIDFKLLLGLIISVFSAEWFIRKYNGLI